MLRKVRNMKWVIGEKIRGAQERDKFLQKKLTTKIEEKEYELCKYSSGIKKFRDRNCKPPKEELRKLMMEETHKSSLSIHLGGTKLYRDFKKMFLWFGIRKSMVEFVRKQKLNYKKLVRNNNP